MDFVEETANFCKALAEAITQREAAFGNFDVAHGHEWLLGQGLNTAKGNFLSRANVNLNQTYTLYTFWKVTSSAGYFLYEVG